MNPASIARASPAGRLSVAAFVASLALRAAPSFGAQSLPPWLEPRPPSIAWVDVAPWVTPDEPEAALTENMASAERDYSTDAGRPADVVYQPVGVRVRVVRVMRDGRVALVHGIGARWQAYALLDRLVPEIPPGTALKVAGGFGGAADFFARLTAAEAPAQLATGTRLSALETGVAPYDPANSDLVRLRVRVMSGASRGRTGWIPVAYTGLPVAHVGAGAGITAKACSCRLVRFDVREP